MATIHETGEALRLVELLRKDGATAGSSEMSDGTAVVGYARGGREYQITIRRVKRQRR